MSLQWENPRASAIAFASTVIFIFLARYLHIIRYALKLTSFTLGGKLLVAMNRFLCTHVFDIVTAALEALGKLVFDSGVSSRLRPRRYYTIPRESLERSLEDVEQLLNFFMIEMQRIVFAENIVVTSVV